MAALRGVPFLVPRGWFCLAADLSAIFQLQGWTCVESSLGDLPGSPVVGTFRFHCSGCRFHPFQGTKIQCAAQCGQKKKKTTTNKTSLGAQAVGSPGSRRGEAIPCSASEAQALFAEAAQAVTGSHHVLRGYKQEAVCSPLGHL